MENKKLETLLKSAEREPKSNFNVYNAYKNQIDALYLSPKEYDKAISRLCKILKI